MRLRGRSPVPPSIAFLVVGLGNPGREHARDRHNVGWMVVDELARRHDGTFKGKFSGRLADVRIGSEKVAMLEPETYMNDSGRSVRAAVSFFKVPPTRLIVVHDEVDLGTGRLQARAGGGLAGHNGLRSVAAELGSQEFLRVRVGVGRPERGDQRPLADYVLSPFETTDNVEEIVARSADAVEAIVAEGIDVAQVRFNER
jgi:PTH1 family peptidyl-tRNA hydrolase